MPNKAFLRTASLLCHPLSVAAMLLLLFNDHWLRWYAPSWWTGKLGDFAWLFFAPFAVAMILALLIPPSPRQEQIVQVLAFGLTGGIFALAKGVPLVHAWIIQIAETILGLPIGLRRDPTDLIALASLGAGWWLWEHHAILLRASAAPGLIALVLAATLTLANGPAPDYGITSVELSSDAAIARASYGAWRSTDGGLTWAETSAQGLSPLRDFGSSNIVTDTLNSNIQYRLKQKVSIERSDDGGKTWRVDYALPSLGEAARVSADRSYRNTYVFIQGPLDGIVEPRTGNAIFAMALEGVLVRRPSGEYAWVTVGPYHHFVFDNPIGLLSGEIALAVSFGLLVLATLATRSIKHWSKYLVLGIAWLVWLGDTVFFPPGRSSGVYGVGLAGLAAVAICGFVAILSAILILIVARRSLKYVRRALIVALSAVPLYFAPYYLWTLNLIPNYNAALVIAFALGAVMLMVGWWVTREITPVIKSEKAKTL